MSAPEARRELASKLIEVKEAQLIGAGPEEILSLMASAFSLAAQLFEDVPLLIGRSVPNAEEPLTVEEVRKILADFNGFDLIWSIVLRRGKDHAP